MPERAELGIAPGARLVVVLPAGAREEAPASLPPLVLPPIAGAEIASRRGWTVDGAGLVLRGACVRAPSDRWAPGLEDIVLGRASDLARGAVGAELDRWNAGEIRAADDRFDQRLEGTGRAGATEMTAVGRHVLGFVGADRAVFVCTLVCTEPGRGGACAEAIDAAEPVGAFVGAPPPSWTTRAILGAAEHPLTAGVLAGAVAVGAVAIVLARRPRPGRS